MKHTRLYFPDKQKLNDEMNTIEAITREDKFKMILKVYNRNIQIFNLDLSNVHSENEKNAALFNYTKNNIYEKFKNYFPELIENDLINQFLIKMIKDLEGYDQSSFFLHIFEELQKKDNIKEEINKISKCINDLYNDKTITPNKVVEQYITKYKACIQKQTNIANSNIYRQPQIAVNTVNASPSVVIPPLVIQPQVPKTIAKPAPKPIPKPITIQKGTQPQKSSIKNDEPKDQIELMKKYFPIGSIVKIKNKTIKGSKNLKSLIDCKDYGKIVDIKYIEVMYEKNMKSKVIFISVECKNNNNETIIHNYLPNHLKIVTDLEMKEYLKNIKQMRLNYEKQNIKTFLPKNTNKTNYCYQ